jgi:hypothetical protein
MLRGLQLFKEHLITKVLVKAQHIKESPFQVQILDDAQQA